MFIVRNESMRTKILSASLAPIILLCLTGVAGISAGPLRRAGDHPFQSDSLITQKSTPADSAGTPARRPPHAGNVGVVVRTIDGDFFMNIPARGVTTAILMQPGVVVQGTDDIGMPAIHLRGGRVDETGYTIEGVGVTDVLFGGRGVAVTAEALEYLKVIPGGAGAGEGGGAPGVIGMQLRTGGRDRWSGCLIAETDRFTGMNNRALGGYSYGYSDWTGTVGGPVPGLGNAVRLFGSAQNTFYRDPNASVRSGWNFTGANAVVTDPLVSQSHPTILKPDTLNLSFPGGNALGGQDSRWIITGTALIDADPVLIRLAGSYSYDRSRTPTVLQDVFNQSRLPLNIERDGFFTLKLSHALSHYVSYEARFNYYSKSYVTEDPQLQGNLFAYGDPAANAALGYTLDTAGGRTMNWPAYSLWGGAFRINEPGTQIAEYEKDEQQSFGGSLALALHLGDHEVKIGGEFSQYTIRRYAPSDVFDWWNLSKQFPDPAALELALVTTTGSDSYGYDIFGKKIDGDVTRSGGQFYFGPRQPLIGDAYVQDEIRLRDVTIGLGLRLDYIDPDSKDVDDPENLFYQNDRLLISSVMKKTETTKQVSPRVDVSFPLDDRNIIHAHYGKYLNQGGFRESYAGAGRISYLTRSLGFNTDTFGWGLKPERITQYEAGFSSHLNDYASIDVTGFYRETNGLTMIELTPMGESWYSYFRFNDDGFGTSKGVEFTLNLLRTRRVAAQVNYTFQDVRGTGSSPADNAGAWSAGSVVQVTAYARPLDFNQAHRGSILLDYRFAKDDGGDILERMGLNVLVTFNSGHSFTILTEPQRGPSPSDPRFQIPAEPIGSSTTPWFLQLDARLDKVFSLGPVSLDVYLYAINLLGSDNAVDVFPRTGDPGNDGWFLTADGKADAAANGPQYVAFYNAVNDGKNSGNWGPPRQIRFGARLEF